MNRRRLGSTVEEALADLPYPRYLLAVDTLLTELVAVYDGEVIST